MVPSSLSEPVADPAWDPSSDLLAALVALCRTEMPAGERAAAVLPFCDTLGVLLGGAGDPRLRALMATLSLSPSAGPGKARLPGGTCWGAAPDIALAIGFAAHLLDFDDDETEVAMAHLSAPSLSAALAVAGRSGSETRVADLIDAYVTGCKAMLLLGSAVNPALYRAGWHATSVLGIFGAAAAAARLLALDEPAAARAFSLAASAASGPRGAFGGEGKPLQVGLAAAQGVRVALLAQAGWQGAEEALAGARGVLTRMAPLRPAIMPAAFPPPGFVTKLYPSCTATHAAIAELVDLRARASIGVDVPLEEIHCGLDSFVPSILIQGLPDGPDAARFSMGYCLAYAAIHGSVGPEAFALKAFAAGRPADPAIRAMMGRITVGSDDSLPKGPSGIATGASVTLIWQDGTRLSGRRVAAPGSQEAPLTAKELQRKFVDCLTSLCDAQSAVDLWNRVSMPFNFSSAGALLDALPPAFSTLGQD